MLTLEKLTAAAQELPAEFSLGQLVDKLLADEPVPASAAPAATPPSVETLFGIAASLPPADREKSVKEWEAERIQEKYGL